MLQRHIFDTPVRLGRVGERLRRNQIYCERLGMASMVADNALEDHRVWVQWQGFTSAVPMKYRHLMRLVQNSWFDNADDTMCAKGRYVGEDCPCTQHALINCRR